MSLFSKILPTILATIKGKERHKVKLVWSFESWTSNIFRLWELLFWREAGIRPYNSVTFKKNGEIDTIQFHCVEAAVCYAEIVVRKFLKKLFTWDFWLGFDPTKVRIVFPAFAGGYKMPSDSPYLFAIAVDTNDTTFGGTGTTTQTRASYPMATTSTGILFCNAIGGNGADTNTASTFAGNNMTKISRQAPSYRWAYLFYRLGATGTGDIVITFSADPGVTSLAGFSYTGASTSAIDSTNTGTGTSVTSLSVSTTVVASGCWLAGFFLDNDGNSQTAGASTTRINSSSLNYGIYHSNGTVGTGSQALAVACGSGNIAGCVASFAPDGGGGGAATPLQMLMGVGT